MIYECNYRKVKDQRREGTVILGIVLQKVVVELSNYQLEMQILVQVVMLLFLPEKLLLLRQVVDKYLLMVVLVLAQIVVVVEKLLFVEE